MTNENGIQTAGAERRSADRFAAAVVALFFVVCVCYSLCTPQWLYADEPFHYYYIKAIMHEGRLPTHTESYEAAHPPLYYLAATAWSLPFKEKDAGFLDNWIRLLSALMGAATVFVIYRIGRDCLDAPWLGAGMAVFAAANPVLAVTGSVISNDIAVILASNTAMYLMLRMCRNGGSVKTAAICGAAAGLCCLFKITANFIVIFFAAFYAFLPANRTRGAWRIIGELAVFGAVFAAICGWWYVLGMSSIGNKVLFNPVIDKTPNPLYLPHNFAWFLKGIMMTFWLPFDILRGQPAAVPFIMKLFYTGLSGIVLVLCGATVIGIRGEKDRWKKHLVLCFALCAAIFFAQQFALNMQFPNSQARYMFTWLGGLAAMAVLPLQARLGRFYKPAVTAALVLFTCLHAAWAFVYLLGTKPIPFIIE